ncbi:hypothetical protein BS47DRAFT_1365927 [Hydnum rufescens UP504]|uniref:Ubiquitin-like protease family profile domain-containing protein n=1 Tax=Hydnum rufescens UP504 TaxID=1448309 RepID=A0A9P6DN18_9AGAM|nr:hypothetical protein BS47DRAFT_1365927 [Hydnum rufescens UP504]
MPVPTNASSIIVSNVYLPLWLVNVWKAWLWVHDLHILWATAIEWVADHENEISAAHVHTVQTALDKLIWAHKIHGFCDSTAGVGALTHYLSPNCLATTDMDHYRELLHEELDKYGEGDLEHVQLVSPDYVNRIIQACASPEIYWSRNYRYIREMGLKLNGQITLYFAGVMNVNNSHWVAFIIDAKSHTINIGDSQLPCTVSNRGLPDQWHHYLEKPICAFQFWLQQSDKAAKCPGTAYTYGNLPITQQCDGSSCGIFAQNALAAYFFPTLTLVAP